MSDFDILSTAPLLDYAVQPTATVTLDAAAIDRAIVQSQEVSASDPWQTYLNALALLGLEQWLQERAPSLPFERSHALNSMTAGADAVCHLSVGDFKLCVITTGSLMDAVVSLPQRAIDQAEAAHFYVLLEVIEEQGQVSVMGFLRRDVLLQQQQAHTLQPDADGDYALPLTWFESDPDQLLLYLRCLEPTAIPRSDVADQTAVTPSARPSLATTLSQFQDVSQQLAQPVVNAGLWLRDELDHLAQQLSWQLMPPLATASAMRSTTDDFTGMLTELTRSAIAIPSQARVAYRDLLVDSLALRLHAIAWPLTAATTPEPEWTLVLILGAQPGSTLTQAVTLRVSDAAQVLVERVLEPAPAFGYVYTSVIGGWNEQFITTIDLMNGQSLTLQPFAFAPDAAP